MLSCTVYQSPSVKREDEKTKVVTPAPRFTFRGGARTRSLTYMYIELPGN